MKKKKCPQCKNLVSVTAPTCLYCGRPNKFVTNDYVRRKWDKEYKIDKNIIKKKFPREILLLLFIIIIIIIINLYK